MDVEDNIGYALLTASPIRKNAYPYLSCRVLDGTSSAHDWEGLLDASVTPFVVNPKKGYIITANNRIVPENSKFDIGATRTNTARFLRIDEIIRNKLELGHKFTA
jgi:penicillin amidase